MIYGTYEGDHFYVTQKGYCDYWFSGKNILGMHEDLFFVLETTESSEKVTGKGSFKFIFWSLAVQMYALTYSMKVK